MKKAATQDQQDFAATLHAWVKSRVSTLDELQEVSGYNRCDLSRMSTGGRIANDFEIDCIMQAIGIIDARLCRTMAKEREMSEVKIDWNNAPEGATHYSKRFGEFYKAEDGFLLNYQNEQMQWIVLKDWHVDILNCEHLAMIKRPESITDVARSIEAARQDEKAASNVLHFGETVQKAHEQIQGAIKQTAQKMVKDMNVAEPERKHSHYFKDVSDVDAIDLYHVARLYDITDPALFHAFKKIACAGKRGAKDQAQDVQEAIDALKRWQELNV